MAQIFNNTDLFFQAVPSNSTIITANKRLTSIMRSRYSSWKQQCQETVWQTPSIMPLDSWLQELWTCALTCGLVPPKRLLHKTQARFLWYHIICDVTKQIDTYDAIKMAGLIEQAWELLHEFQIPLSHPLIKTTEEGRYLLSCAKHYLEWCKTNEAIDYSMLFTECLTILHERKIPQPSSLFFVGFIEQTPLVSNLTETLRKLDYFATEIHFEQSPTNPKRLAFTNTDEELQTMMRWARALCEKNHELTLGCIVPELNQHRRLLERILHLEYTTETHLFNISSGTALGEEPIIHLALEIFKLIDRVIPLPRISAIIRSPFIAQAKQQETERALLDMRLREIGNSSYIRTHLNSLFKTDESLQQAATHLAKLDPPFTNSPRSWQEIWLTTLASFEWPGDRPLNQREYLATTQFYAALHEFAELDCITTSLDKTEAFAWITAILAETLFQPPSASKSPIQILGMLEASDLLFDACWIAGLDDHNWPKLPKPNPFLPFRLQKQYNMPHCSYSRELQFSEQMTEQFLKRSIQTIFSYPLQEKELVLKPSALIRKFPLQDTNLLQLPVVASPQEEPRQQLSQTVTEKALVTVTQKSLAGGSRIFKLQAACPFHAFAELLLAGKNVVEPKEGITRLERGILIHKTLELFWKNTKTHSNLISLTERKLEQYIHECILQAVKLVLINRRIQKTIVDLEIECLHQLLDSWLAIEKKRPPFEIYALEQRFNISLGELQFHIQIDRIDKLPQNNSFLLIDYKTSRTDINHWFGDRPEEPQLPLYTIKATIPISAMAYVELRPGNIKMNGIAASANIHPWLATMEELAHKDGVEKTWEQQCARWLRTLTALANDFSSGNFPVDPKNQNLTCRYCDYSSLCRITERNLQQ